MDRVSRRVGAATTMVQISDRAARKRNLSRDSFSVHRTEAPYPGAHASKTDSSADVFDFRGI